jgi:hypothetical protein
MVRHINLRKKIQVNIFLHNKENVYLHFAGTGGSLEK